MRPPLLAGIAVVAATYLLGPLEPRARSLIRFTEKRILIWMRSLYGANLLNLAAEYAATTQRRKLARLLVVNLCGPSPGIRPRYTLAAVRPFNLAESKTSGCRPSFAAKRNVRSLWYSGVPALALPLAQ